MKTQSTINVLYAQYGVFEDSGQTWANLYILDDTIINEHSERMTVVGRKPAKMSIVPQDGGSSSQLAQKIIDKLKQAKSFPCPINVELESTVKGGLMVFNVINLLEK